MSESLRALARTRWRVSLAFTGAMIFVYFGFVLLIAFNKPLMGHLVVPGLTVGILLGALVIVASAVLTYAYVQWANRRHDPAVERLRREESR